MPGFELYGLVYKIERKKFPNDSELYSLVIFQCMRVCYHVIIIIIVLCRSIRVDDYVSRFLYIHLYV